MKKIIGKLSKFIFFEKTDIFVFIASFSALVFAYISQYFFGHQPCELCLYQRWPYFALATISFVSATYPNKQKNSTFKNIFLASFLILFFIEIILAFYHVGVEQKIFAGLSGCSSAQENFSTLEELEIMIKNAPAVKCDTPSFIFLNLSMAAWNLIYSALITIFLTFCYFKNFKKNH